MKRKKVEPTPALMVSSHSSISDCVRKMREHRVGSLLVTAYDDEDRLVGIFTERDLLKWIDEVQHGGHWDKPVEHLMSKPVTTIRLSELDRAAEVMVRGGFRHLPVIDVDGNQERVLGVISMRDLLRELVMSREAPLHVPATESGPKPPAVLLAAENSGQELRRVLTLGGKLEVERLSFAAGLEAASVSRSRMLLIDLDDVAPEVWANFLKNWRSIPKHPPTMALYDPRRQDPVGLQLLQTLSQSGALEIHPKPLNVIGFLARVREVAGV